MAQNATTLIHRIHCQRRDTYGHLVVGLAALIVKPDAGDRTHDPEDNRSSGPTHAKFVTRSVRLTPGDLTLRKEGERVYRFRRFLVSEDTPQTAGMGHDTNKSVVR